MISKILRAGALASLCAVFLLPTLVASQGEDPPPEGVTQLLPRGGIPAIFNPHFVGASSAEIPDDAWVLGVVIDGQAKAYDLNILNHHEIVNDVVGGTPVAPTW
jgi:hypothetical protein